MPILGPDCILFRRSGPVAANNVKAGDEVLILSHGKADWAIANVSNEWPAAEGVVRLYTGAASVCLAPTTKLVTSAGVRTAADLSDMRDRSAVGRMDGAWPLLEQFLAFGVDRLPVGALEAMGVSLATAVSISTAFGVSYRIGKHDARTLQRFARCAIQRECTVQAASAGWAWLGAVDASPRIAFTDYTVDTLKECALAIWQEAPDGSYLLPMEHSDLAAYSVAILQYCGFPIRLNYRPRYLPSTIALQLGDATTPHVAVQAVSQVDTAKLKEIRVNGRGAYLVVSGLLCAP